MNIQPIAPSAAVKTEDRPAAASAASGKPAADAVPASRAEVSDAVKKINEHMLSSAQGLEFSIDEESKHIVVKVVDVATREVVRQMPSKEALEIAKSIDRMRGLLINQTA
jgi:flagellar protein FlaG